MPHLANSEFEEISNSGSVVTALDEGMPPLLVRYRATTDAKTSFYSSNIRDIHPNSVVIRRANYQYPTKDCSVGSAGAFVANFEYCDFEAGTTYFSAELTSTFNASEATVATLNATMSQTSALFGCLNPSHLFPLFF